MRGTPDACGLDLPCGVPQFFFDDTLIAHQRRLVRRWQPATIYPWPILAAQRPWEGRTIGNPGTILPDPSGGYRMYYQAGSAVEKGRALTCLATSEDGFQWERPELGLVDWQGNRANNIVLASQSAFGFAGILHDAEDARLPYKLMAFRNEKIAPLPEPNWGLWTYQSEDGLHWLDRPRWGLNAGDRSTLMATKPQGKFVAYTRGPGMMRHTGGRAVSRTESEDFVSWSAPELVLAPDLSDEPDVEFYGMIVFERHGWHLGLLEYWRSATDVKEVHLAVSRDGKAWTRPLPHQPFIAGNYDWNRSSSSCASNGPLWIEEQMVCYFGGSFTAHHRDTAQRHGVIGYASLPLDRFCAIEGTAGGDFTTVPLCWPGGDLVLNADTRESPSAHPTYCSGSIQVEALAAEGQGLPEWSGEQQATFRGNTHCRGQIHPGTVRWPGERGLEALRGQVIRLRFRLGHARLYTFQAGG